MTVASVAASPLPWIDVAGQRGEGGEAPEGPGHVLDEGLALVLGTALSPLAVARWVCMKCSAMKQKREERAPNVGVGQGGQRPSPAPGLPTALLTLCEDSSRTAAL